MTMWPSLENNSPHRKLHHHPDEELQRGMAGTDSS